MKIENNCSIVEEQEALWAFVYALENGVELFEFKTSGSTSKPKIMHFRREQLIISARQTIDFFGLTENDVLLCPFSMQYVAAKMMVVRAFVLNATLVFVGPSGNPFANCQNLEISFAALVPLQLQNTLAVEQERNFLNSIPNVIVGGAPISKALETQILGLLGNSVYHTYGMTETLSHVALRKISENEEGNWYKALPNVELKSNSDETLMVKSAVTKDWLKTNDLVELEQERFKWLGRKDMVINSGAYKIHIEALEEKLNMQFKDIQCFICGIDSEKFGFEPLLIVEGALDKLLYSKWAKEHLHPYEIPKKILSIEKTPLLASGKIDRIGLASMAAEAVLYGKLENLV